MSAVRAKKGGLYILERNKGILKVWTFSNMIEFCGYVNLDSYLEGHEDEFETIPANNFRRVFNIISARILKQLPI